ncbi:hypothetical protein LTR35_012917 [Friedmanniomyces endolithicus]|nr:hypothetical protein LTR35_012917 [Friedmanniomyces endolithicus]KAK0285476.1 hypothetical protein LTS00_010837 [Friedmanniomyces endolithicus]KAK0986944.1 hypothetical protein LTR54_013328 [Friedmanniomyces endolithicus]
MDSRWPPGPGGNAHGTPHHHTAQSPPNNPSNLPPPPPGAQFPPFHQASHSLASLAGISQSSPRQPPLSNHPSDRPLQPPGFPLPGLTQATGQPAAPDRERVREEQIHIKEEEDRRHRELERQRLEQAPPHQAQQGPPMLHQDFDFMDPPPQETITTSLFDLWALGALNNLGELTELGRKMTNFPMDPPLAKLIIMSSTSAHTCSEEILTIVSMLSVPSVFYRPKERLEESDAAREKFFVHDSDHLTLLTVYQQWVANGMKDGWCTKHFLHPKALHRAREIRQQIADIMASLTMPLVSCGYDLDVVRQCICSGFYPQAARRKGLGEYINLRTSVAVQLHPTSALFNSGDPPDYVVYHELILTSKEYMSCVTAVDAHWLADMGGVFYSVKEKGYGAAGRREVEYSKKAELEEAIRDDRERAKRMEGGEGGFGAGKKIMSGGNGVKKALSRGSAVVKPTIGRRR